MTEKRRYSVAFIPRVTQVYDKEKDKQLSSFELDDLLLKFEKENKELKQQLSDIDKLINDLGSEEMCRQYDEIIGDFE